jgi:hypothetical protein
MGYSGARGTLIYEKNLKAKISCQTPFNSFGQCCESVGSVCFWASRIWIRILLQYNQAKIVRKILIPIVCVTFYVFLSLKNDVTVPSKSNKPKNFCGFFLKVTDENCRIRSRIRNGTVSQRYGSLDPDPYQYVTDPQHWFWEKNYVGPLIVFSI